MTPNDFLYTGEQRDTNAGFYFLRARYYSESIGRFVTMDLEVSELDLENTIFEPRSLHKYLYAESDPINKTDPSGYVAIGGYGISLSPATINIIPLALLGACISNLLLSTSVVLATGGTPAISASAPCAAGRRPCPPCPPCPTPPASRSDLVPPTRPHHPCPGNHTHLYRYESNQNSRTCQCFCNLREEVICQ
jgi:RHS repeat-associated protein